MTSLKPSTALVRETATCYRGRPLLVLLHAGYMTVRPKGTRQAYSVDYRAVYELAGKLAARERQALKQADRKGKKRSKKETRP